MALEMLTVYCIAVVTEMYNACNTLSRNIIMIS